MVRQGLPRVGGTAGGAGVSDGAGTVGTAQGVAAAEQVSAIAPAQDGVTNHTTNPTRDGVAEGGSVTAAAPARAGGRQGLPRTGAAAEGERTAPPAVAAADGDASAASQPTSPAVVEPRQPVVMLTAPTKPVAQAGAAKSGRGRLVRGGLLAAGLLVLMAAAVLMARWLVTLESVQDFLVGYPGESELPHGAPVGIPAWLGWQHFFNVFFMVLIIRSGWQVRTQHRPPASWTPRWGSNPKKISITLWLHQSLDILWLVNGAIFVLLLAVTGQWMRVVPTSWDVFPNALSAALQYVSLDWPTENGWVNYNSLQVLAYFVTIFGAAPLAAISGFRMSGMWPAKATRLSKAYPIELARAIHFPVMLYFVGFIITHVALVLATGALRNLNHMYGGQDAVNWIGFWIFFASLLVIVGGWFAARPLVLAPLASLFGKVGR